MRDLNRATKTVQSWNLDSCTIQTLEGLRFPIAPILQIKEQDLKAKILICESNEKSKIFSSLKSKLAAKLDEALYNLKWAKSKLEFYERGYFVFGANNFYLNEEITVLEKERSQRNPSFIVMEDSASFF